MQLDAAVDTIRRSVPGCVAIYLFGSHANGAPTRDSDIDLAVLAEAPLDDEARWSLAQVLARALGRDVDLVDLLRASSVMRVQVLETGNLLFQSDVFRRQEFEAIALSDYARLNEERRGILADIRARGSVYG
jgi:predicted nucleotidyltransferase